MYLMEMFENTASTGDTFQMWHGGRNLEANYKEHHPNRSKQMEYGPGLYLTTFYSTASKYSKGGGKTYLVTVKHGTDIKDVTVSTTAVMQFLKNTRIPRKAQLVAEIKDRYPDTIPLINFMNLSVNLDCLAPSNSVEYRKFFVECGADYNIVSGYGGFGNQKIAIIFNPAVIQRVEIVKSKDVSADMWEL